MPFLFLSFMDVISKLRCTAFEKHPGCTGRPVIPAFVHHVVVIVVTWLFFPLATHSLFLSWGAGQSIWTRGRHTLFIFFWKNLPFKLPLTQWPLLVGKISAPLWLTAQHLWSLDFRLSDNQGVFPAWSKSISYQKVPDRPPKLLQCNSRPAGGAVFVARSVHSTCHESVNRQNKNPPL